MLGSAAAGAAKLLVMLAMASATIDAKLRVICAPQMDCGITVRPFVSIEEIRICSHADRICI
jgi:hypothetical protein